MVSPSRIYDRNLGEWAAVLSGCCFYFDVANSAICHGMRLITLPIVHLPRIASLSAMTTISLTCTFRLSLCHAYFVTTAGSTSLLQRFQKESTISCTNSTQGRGFSVSFVSCCSLKEHVVRTPIFAFIRVIWNTADRALIYEIFDF